MRGVPPRGRRTRMEGRFRYTYLSGPKKISIKKEGRHADAAEFFERNEFSRTR